MNALNKHLQDGEAIIRDMIAEIVRVRKQRDDLRSATEGLLKDIENWPSLHDDGDYLHAGMLIPIKQAIEACKTPDA